MLEQINEKLVGTKAFIVTVAKIKSTENWPEVFSNGEKLPVEQVYVKESVEASASEARGLLATQMVKSIQDWIKRKTKGIDTPKIYVHLVQKDFFLDTLIKGGVEKHSADLKFGVYVAKSPITNS
jgi:hypothetical protein